ncbi:MAG: ABC transporter ATP-binding protein [Acidimicrobiales bacterium]|nr:ABC transporter ATP-binding protein [Acidimicrobiia bacterium]NNC81021.1 ABC transporter ATP-binding protein [Acidimicrobiales bacterium]RZV48183.1 MAG: ABC transporter ATP-binding protein [Acidimicrobiales bacterium]
MNAETTRPAIEVRSLRKKFGRTEVLRSVDLEIPRNSVFGFLGPNGAGKTTTMKILVGLLHANGGSASIMGHDVARDSLQARAAIGYLPQAASYWKHLKVRGVLNFTAQRYLDLPRPQLRQHVDETIELAGLTDLVDRKVAKLSGGERQRLGIAEAWVGRPDVLILDEPSSGLDPEGRHEVLSLLDRLRKDATILYSTHILDDIERIADHIAVIDNGSIVAQGSIDSFLVGSTALYSVGFSGPLFGAVEALQTEAWVDAVEPETDGRVTVAVNDRSHAELELLRSFVASGVSVTDFRPARRSLEDIYLEIVGADDDDG